MHVAGYSAAQWLVLAEHELLLFAGVFFLVGALDDLAVDCVWLWLRLTGRARSPRLPRTHRPDQPLSGMAAVFVPAWQEAGVIGATVSHLLDAWPHADLRLYVGSYRNDAATIAAVSEAARGDPRVRVVVVGHDGPTTKADCLNRLYQALCHDEWLAGRQARMVVMHDAEDMVDPAALGLLDQAIGSADLVQLPVVPVVHPGSRWISAHYAEEFAEAHGKVLVVRDALGAGIPLAGVGCAIARPMLARLAATMPGRRSLPPTA